MTKFIFVLSIWI